VEGARVHLAGLLDAVRFLEAMHRVLGDAAEVAVDAQAIAMKVQPFLYAAHIVALGAKGELASQNQLFFHRASIGRDDEPPPRRGKGEYYPP
jgi:hypothetical protein